MFLEPGEWDDTERLFKIMSQLCESVDTFIIWMVVVASWVFMDVKVYHTSPFQV